MRHSQHGVHCLGSSTNEPNETPITGQRQLSRTATDNIKRTVVGIREQTAPWLTPRIRLQARPGQLRLPIELSEQIAHNISEHR